MRRGCRPGQWTAWPGSPAAPPTPEPLQHAASVALTVGSEYYRLLCDSYRAKRDYLMRELQRIGFSVRRPAGTYFLAADFRPLGFRDDVAFCRMLIEKIGVAAIPLSAFYADGFEQRIARFCFAKKDETLALALDRLAAL